jgi:hypothetical protein
LPVPEFMAERQSVAADVTICFGKVSRASGLILSGRSYNRVDAKTVYLSCEEVGTFLIQNGNQITIEQCAAVDERLLRWCLIGSVFGVLLRQRGLLLLHASALVLKDCAVAFLGEHGRGKSTLAAALHGQGCGVLADDLTAIQFSREGAVVLPSFPRLKLWPDAAIALGQNVKRLPRLYSQIEKRALRVVNTFPRTSHPLICIYVLAEGQDYKVEPLSPHEALIELIRHAYGVQLLRAEEASKHFLQCGKLAQRISVRRLRIPRILHELRTLARQIENDLHNGFIS